jgi:hypothetical protein
MPGFAGKVTAAVALIATILINPAPSLARAQVIEFYCLSCGYSNRFMQGHTQQEAARNVQNLIVVCERSREIRQVKIALDPNRPVINEPLAATQQGTGVSELLGVELPKFIVPGNTCPLYPVSAYVDMNICPIDGAPGFEAALISAY